MRIQKIQEAVEEAQRFIERASEHRERLVSEGSRSSYYRITGTKESAALKRASLDLTRALAEMRKS